MRPGDQVWVDFYLPATDPLFRVDVSRSFLWLGELWAAAIGALPGVSGPVGWLSRLLPDRGSGRAVSASAASFAAR